MYVISYFIECISGILLLYQGMEDGKSFTLSFGLEEGYPVLKYYVSEIQHSHMKIGRVLEPYAWHSFNLVITKDLGTIYVHNNTYLIASEALGVEMSQNLTGNLFVGNHPDDNVAIFGKGFKGKENKQIKTSSVEVIAGFDGTIFLKNLERMDDNADRKADKLEHSIA
ncbi:hypothetical protein MAR_017524 [Mya arenaria]|uniref:Laminin G domain-containing protein n=1 Tax=Mya arenaria TaxID=6604 RepID=A0ABY7EFI0_MYAAR|nr:hypothetical protein MAR_017524 [Mya arenaria]